MKKRTLSVLLAAALMASLTGCGGSGQSSTTTDSSAKTEATETTEEADTADTADTASTDTSWPEKSINIIVPFSAGGDTDYNARTMAQYLGEELGQSVVVTNVTGSGGTIAANQVKDSANDGYTILCTHVSLNMSAVTKTIDWDYSDLTMGGIFAMGLGEAVIVRGDAPWNTLQDLIDDSAANPGKYTMSATTGASTMWAPIALNKAGANLNIVDAGGASDRIVALLGEHVDIICNSISSVKDYLATGDFKILATCAPERSEEYPDVPTMEEEGLDCAYSMDYTFFFPVGTDQAIVDKLNNAVNKIVNENEEYKQGIYDTYQQKPVCYDQAESEAYWSDELSRLTEMQDYFLGN